jgi:hypothetical protein
MNVSHFAFLNIFITIIGIIPKSVSVHQPHHIARKQSPIISLPHHEPQESSVSISHIHELMGFLLAPAISRNIIIFFIIIPFADKNGLLCMYAMSSMV